MPGSILAGYSTNRVILWNLQIILYYIENASLFPGVTCVCNDVIVTNIVTNDKYRKYCIISQITGDIFPHLKWVYVSDISYSFPQFGIFLHLSFPLPIYIYKSGHSFDTRNNLRVVLAEVFLLGILEKLFPILLTIHGQ